MRLKTLMLLALALVGAACAIRPPWEADPSVQIARILADAEVKTVQAITAALTKADAAACEVK